MVDTAGKRTLGAEIAGYSPGTEKGGHLNGAPFFRCRLCKV
jgi:hypothetical protein